MSKNLDLVDWQPTSWQSKPAQQQPTYPDRAKLDVSVAALAKLPPIVVSWEVEALKSQIAAAQRGERFILQGGDCAETFDDCESDTIARKLKILLQMSLVLLHGMKKPVVRAANGWSIRKPRSADRTRDGVTLPSLSRRQRNRPAHSGTEPLILSCYARYERAALR